MQVQPEEEEEEYGTHQYPLVVANILAGTLCDLSVLLVSRVAEGGVLLLSGIWGGSRSKAFVRRLRARA